MWTCPNCKTEVEPEFDVCWSCGTSRDGEVPPAFNPELDGMIGAEQYEAEIEAKRHDDLVTVATFLNAAEAHLARSRLEAEGIPACVMEELTGTMWGLVHSGTPLRVPQSYVERAQAALENCETRTQQAGEIQPEHRVIAAEVRQGTRAEIPTAVQVPILTAVQVPTEEEPDSSQTETPMLLVARAYEAALIGLLIFFLPVHLYSVYLLFGAARLPGDLDATGQRKFTIAICVDLIAIPFFWLPSTLYFIGILVYAVVRICLV
jgi:hypothetical protein